MEAQCVTVCGVQTWKAGRLSGRLRPKKRTMNSSGSTIDTTTTTALTILDDDTDQHSQATKPPLMGSILYHMALG